MVAHHGRAGSVVSPRGRAVQAGCRHVLLGPVSGDSRCSHHVQRPQHPVTPARHPPCAGPPPPCPARMRDHDRDDRAPGTA